MKFLRNTLDKVKHDFEKGGKWEKYYYVFEAIDTFAFVPNTTTGVKGCTDPRCSRHETTDDDRDPCDGTVSVIWNL